MNLELTFVCASIDCLEINMLLSDLGVAKVELDSKLEVETVSIIEGLDKILFKMGVDVALCCWLGDMEEALTVGDGLEIFTTASSAPWAEVVMIVDSDTSDICVIN